MWWALPAWALDAELWRLAVDEVAALDPGDPDLAWRWWLGRSRPPPNLSSDPVQPPVGQSHDADR
jgi:hypothetical protein